MASDILARLASLSPTISIDDFVAAARLLRTDRRARDSSRLHAIEGVRNIVRCTEHAIEPVALLVSPVLLPRGAGRDAVRAFRERGTPVIRATPERFRALSCARQASGVAAIVRQHAADHLPPDVRGVWLCVGQVRSPGNLGTLMRSAAAVEAGGLIFLGDAADPFDPVVVRASMGAVFSLRLVRSRPADMHAWVARHAVQTIAADPHARLCFDRVRYRDPCIIMLGEERRGLTPDQRALSGLGVRIPMARGTDSLNVGVAGTLLLYASRRGLREQR